MKRTFLVSSMCLLADEGTPIAETSEVVIEKSSGDNIHIPVSVQYFANKEEFMSAMTVHAMHMWELHEEILEENKKINEEQERILLEMEFEGKLN